MMYLIIVAVLFAIRMYSNSICFATPKLHFAIRIYSNSICFAISKLYPNLFCDPKIHFATSKVVHSSILCLAMLSSRYIK